MRARAPLGPEASPHLGGPKGVPLAAPESPFRRLLRGPVLYLLIVLIGIWLFVALANRERPAEEIRFSDFQQALDEGQVQSAMFLEG
ncbi:MAG TPA: ATP-dependent metallopeptidase FtsH/Yme1/Tma family protein, partial [Actinomycetota bacterium]|nr:ATP-dependent metallopeptidase FtsH/Yme1/Tma family protein [Actinomycetota bacterium]